MESKESHARRSKARYERCKANGTCFRCGKKLDADSKVHCAACLEQKRADARAYNESLKAVGRKRPRGAKQPVPDFTKSGRGNTLEKNRKCHDCGAPTSNYRCPSCLARWRKENGIAAEAN